MILMFREMVRKKQQLTQELVRNQMTKTGGTPYEVTEIQTQY